MSKIVHLSTVHKANDVRVFYKQCRTLAAAGYDVTLITNAPKDYVLDGVKVMAIRSKAGNRLLRMTKSVTEVYRRAKQENADLYHIHDAELVFAGLLLRLGGKKVVYDAHEDLVSQIKSKNWILSPIRGLVAGMAGAIEWVSSRLFSSVVVANPTQNTRFPVDKVVSVQNFPLLEEAYGISKVDYYEREHCVLYVGGVGTIRGARQMVQAIELVNKKIPAELTLAGPIESEELLSALSSEPGWEYTRYLGFVNREELLCELGRARIGLSVVHPVPNHLSNQPVKLFEYMMAGIPTIASDFANYRRFVSDIGSGLMVDPMNPHMIADAIVELLSQTEGAHAMGEKGLEAIMDQYNWSVEAESLLGMYQKILA